MLLLVPSYGVKPSLKTDTFLPLGLLLSFSIIIILNVYNDLLTIMYVRFHNSKMIVKI